MDSTASSSPEGQPELDLLILTGTVHTMDELAGTATAVGVRDGAIAWLGQAEHSDPKRAKETVEAPGGCLTPGLVDAHIHPILGLELARGLDLSSVQTLSELHAQLSIVESSGTDEAWHLAWGLDPGCFGGRNPTAEDLDAAIPDRPALIRLFDGHSAVVNSRGLEMAGVTGTEAFASASQVELDAAGSPTGFLKEWEAMDLVAEHLPSAPFEDRLEALLGVLSMMADAGLTGGQVLDHSDGMIELLEVAETRGELPIRLQISPWIMPADGDDRLQEVIDLQDRRGRRWVVDGVKLMIDGTIDNGSAWLRRPDANGESTGPLWLDPAAYDTVLARLDALGIRTTTHAIGDAGVEHVLDAIARLPARPHPVQGSPVPPRHRIEHIETTSDDLVRRFAELNVAASMQPTHCTLYCSGDGTDNWSRRLGPERAGNAWRLGSLRRAGVALAVGSDWPIAPCEPLRIIADGQLRREAGKPEQTPIVAEEALTARELLEGFTTQRALSWGDPHGGRIRVGAPADLTLLGADPLATPPDDVPSIPVVATVVAGALRRPAA